MIHKAIPQLPSLDLDRTLRFYTEKLQFKLGNRYPDFLILSNEDVELHFWKCTDPAIPKASSIYLRVSDIQSMYELHERFGIVHPKAHLEDKPWGLKEFSSLDPDGNLLKFGELSFK